MIRNQSYMPQSAPMHEYYQQMQTSPNQPNSVKPAEKEQPAQVAVQCCVDLSHLHNFHHMHEMHAMHGMHPMHGFDHMDDFHHMDGYHPMMHEYHPMEHEMWDDHMHYDHHHPHDGWEFSSINYHHAWFHPMMHHHPHVMWVPVICSPVANEHVAKKEND